MSLLHPLDFKLCTRPVQASERPLRCVVLQSKCVAVGWVKIKISLMAQLKGLTAKFKLM